MLSALAYRLVRVRRVPRKIERSVAAPDRTSVAAISAMTSTVRLRAPTTSLSRAFTFREKFVSSVVRRFLISWSSQQGQPNTSRPLLCEEGTAPYPHRHASVRPGSCFKAQESSLAASCFRRPVTSLTQVRFHVDELDSTREEGMLLTNSHCATLRSKHILLK